MALTVERTGEGMDRRPVTVQGDIGIQRDILTGIGLAVRRRRCEGAQLRLGADENGAVSEPSPPANTASSSEPPRTTLPSARPQLCQAAGRMAARLSAV